MSGEDILWAGICLVILFGGLWLVWIIHREDLMRVLIQ